MTKRTCHLGRKQDSYSLGKLVGLDWSHLRTWSGPPTLRTSDTMAGYAIGPFPEMMLGSLFLSLVKRKIPPKLSLHFPESHSTLASLASLPSAPSTNLHSGQRIYPTPSFYLWLIQPQHPSSLRTFTQFSDPVHLSLLPRGLSHPPTA